MGQRMGQRMGINSVLDKRGQDAPPNFAKTLPKVANQALITSMHSFHSHVSLAPGHILRHQ